MAKEVTIAPKTIWEKLLIHWHTKNHSQQIYDIALIIATAIYTNHKIYAEEMAEAHRILESHLKDENSIAEIMEYIQMKLLCYMDKEAEWYKDLAKCRELIKKDQALFEHFLNIFESDHTIEQDEEDFIESIKVMLLRS